MSDREQKIKRMKELIEPIDKTVLMCDNTNYLAYVG
jgi:hypothetical protein